MLTIVLAGVGLLIFGLLIWRSQNGTGSTTFGSAAWADVFTMYKAGLFKQAGLRVGDVAGRLSVFYESTHAITIGASGAGKGTSAILPNLLTAHRAFIIDPGGENTAVAAKAFRANGGAFGCINIFGMFGQPPYSLPDHGFNPLDFLDASSPTFAADALVFAEMLTPRAGGESGSAAYFKDAAQRIKCALLIHIKTAEPRSRQSVTTLYEYISGSADDWENLLEAMKANPTCGGLVIQEANTLERIEGQASEEFSAIRSTIQQDLSWLADPLVREKLSCSDVNFSMLTDAGNGGIISVVLPLEYMESHAAIPRLALACAILQLQRKAQGNEKVLFLIDEAASLGKILRFPSWLATMRKYGAVIWSIWQGVGQIKDLYNQNWQTVIANCGLVQILGVGDPETARYVEELLGKYTVTTSTVNAKGERSVSEAGRALRFADELRRLPKDTQIAFIGNLPALAISKTEYWRRPELDGLYYDNPYLGKKSHAPTAVDRAASVRGRIVYQLIWWLTPDPLAALIITAALVGAVLLWVIGGG